MNEIGADGVLSASPGWGKQIGELFLGKTRLKTITTRDIYAEPAMREDSHSISIVPDAKRAE